MNFGTALIFEAKKWADCHEDKNRPNRSVCVDKIQLYTRGYVSNDPWCAMFVWMNVDKVAKRFKIKNILPKVAGTHLMLNGAEKNGIRVDDKPAVGSIMFYDTTKPGHTLTGHVGFVIEVNNYGVINTIEGNTGDKVGFRTHQVKPGFKFIHVEEMAKGKTISNMQLAGFNPLFIGVSLLFGIGLIFKLKKGK